MSATIEPVEALPTPEEVRETFDRMRASVLAAYRRLEADEAGLREMLSGVEEEQKQMRERYPMFFPEGVAAGGRRSARGTPGIEQRNIVLRTIAEHEDDTIKQIARRTHLSPSWVSHIISEIGRTGSGVLIERERRGRTFVYRLTSAGKSVVNRGGIRE